MNVALTYDASVVNQILNHAEVRPWVADVSAGPIDLSSQIEGGHTLCLLGEHGVFVFYKYDIGFYEVHTAILPEGRGAWAREFAAAGARTMFTATDCVEILTRVPATHDPAIRLTCDAGFRLQFTTPPECLFRGEKVPAHIYALSLQDWAKTAPGMEESGADFHAWLNRQVGADHGEPHEPDPAHNRCVGIVLSMAMGGQLGKAIAWYNRAAIAARHPKIALVGINPPQIRFDAGLLTLAEEGIKFSRVS